MTRDAAGVGLRRRLVPALIAILLLAGVGVVMVLPRAAGTQTVYEGASAFGAIRVEERRDGVRLLRIGEGRAVQTAMDPRRPRELQSPYTRMAMVGLALAPADGAMLFVGLGGGAMPSYVREVRPRAVLDAVEIDPAIIDVAVRWFGLRPDARLRVHAGDGRAFIEAAPTGSWHVIFLDAYSDDEVPYALTTRQFLEAVRSRLTADGVVVGNLWTANALYPSMLATYEAVFDEVVALPVPQRAQHIVLASRGQRLDRASVLTAVRALAAATELGFDLEAMVSAAHVGTPAAGTGRVLEDRRQDAAFRHDRGTGGAAAAHGGSAGTGA